jgi:hypothetical protein
MLSGQMIGLPIIIWLFFTAFHFGNIDQIFAILGLVGIALNFTKWKNSVYATITSFIIMLSPIISRLIQVPIKMFDYLAFQIPLAIFILAYVTFILINIKEKLRTTQGSGYARAT